MNSKPSRLAALAGLAALALAAPAVAAPPPDLDAYVARALKTFGTPGMSVAVVENGRVAVAKGYGVRRLGSPEPADAHTSFPIGSETKAITAAALSVLVDEGKLKWSDRVVDRLPGFAMYDPYVTAHMTVRDLLTHRSGLSLGEGDLLVFPSNDRSRADLVHALRYLKPATGFREQFAYDNILYIVAGALVASVSGQTWEAFVGEHVFAPAGMVDAHPNYQPGVPNIASLHARTDGPIRGVGRQRVIDVPVGFNVIAPAGAVTLSAEDAAKWMNIQLARGVAADGRRVFSREQADEMWKPVVVVPSDAFRLPPALAAMQPDLQAYGLGWFVESWRGHRVIEHSGAVFGAVAMLYLIPDLHVGVSVTINSEDSGARRAVMFHILDRYVGAPETDWIAVLDRTRTQMVAGAEAALKAMPRPTAAADVRTALPLDSYAGAYEDPWYGAMSVRRGGGGLTIRFERTPGMEGRLEPVGGDLFRTIWSDPNIENAFVDFHTQGGRVSAATMRAVSPLADFSFDYQDLHFTPTRDVPGKDPATASPPPPPSGMARDG